MPLSLGERLRLVNDLLDVIFTEVLDACLKGGLDLCNCAPFGGSDQSDLAGDVRSDLCVLLRNPVFGAQNGSTSCAPISSIICTTWQSGRPTTFV